MFLFFVFSPLITTAAGDISISFYLFIYLYIYLSIYLFIVFISEKVKLGITCESSSHEMLSLIVSEK